MYVSLRATSNLLILLLLPVSCGCSNGYQAAPVSGRVEVDHHPLAHAIVTFTPFGGKNLPSSSAVTDNEGKFELTVNDSSKASGAVIGEHTVSIRLDPRNVDKKEAIKHQRQLEILPSIYNTESALKFTVPVGGTTDASFLDLKSTDHNKKR